MGENTWSHELSCFATDLFADLMSRHPLLYMLPRKHGGSHYFTSEVGKCVMLRWHEIRSELERKLRSDFPRFVKKEDCFKQYLSLFVGDVLQSEHNAIIQVFGLSAILLGVVCFVHRRGMTHFVNDASKYLFFMLLSVKPEEFHEEGGWSLLASVSARLLEGYDEEGICRQYLLQTVCNFNASCSTFAVKSSSNLKYSTDTSSGITEIFQEVVSIYHKPVKETENDSADEQDTLNEMTENTLQEVVEISPQHTKESGGDSEQDLTPTKSETKRLSPCESPSILKQKPLVTSISESVVLESKNTTEESLESNEEYLAGPKLVKCPQTEKILNTSECFKASEIESSLKDSSFQASFKLKTSQTNLEVLEESTKRKMPDGVEQSMDDSNNSNAEFVKSPEDFVEPKNCLHESLKAETSTTNFELFDEVDKFVNDNIMSNFQVRFCTEDEIEKIINISEDTESTTENSSQHKPADKVTNNVDEPKTTIKDSTGQKHCDVNSLMRDEVSQTSLELINNCQEESKKENLDNVEVIPPRKNPTCMEPVCDNGSAKIKCSSLIKKSPKVESVKKFTPAKAKIAPSEICEARDNKNKTLTPKNNRKATPVKTPTNSAPKSPMLLVSTRRNKIETPKTLKSDSADRRSPVNLKTPTDRGLPKFQSKSSDNMKVDRRLSLPKASPDVTKSSDKIETSRRLSLTKASPAKTKSSVKPISASAANTKSCIKCIPATDSSKPLPDALLKSKTSYKDLPSNQLKASSSTNSAPPPKCKVDAKDAPVACENNTKLKPKAKNVKESTSVGKLASDKPTVSTESKLHKSSTESLNTRCADTKGNNPPSMSVKTTNHSNTGRTRNLYGKSASVHSKSEKPRWK